MLDDEQEVWICEGVVDEVELFLLQQHFHYEVILLRFEVVEFEHLRLEHYDNQQHTNIQNLQRIENIPLSQVYMRYDEGMGGVLMLYILHE